MPHTHTHEEIREEFIKKTEAREWTIGTTMDGDCEETVWNGVADWWLEKFSLQRSQLISEFREGIGEPETVPCSILIADGDLSKYPGLFKKVGINQEKARMRTLLDNMEKNI